MKALRLLVVYDQPANRQFARAGLEAQGHMVTTADNGAEAVALCLRQGQSFDAIFMDARMPLMNGHEAVRRLRAHPGTACVPIVSWSMTDRIGDCDAYLRKPCMPSDFLSALEEALLTRQATENDAP